MMLKGSCHQKQISWEQRDTRPCTFAPFGCVSIRLFLVPPPQITIRMWLPEKHSRGTQGQAQYVCGWPEQGVLIRMRLDALVLSVIIHVAMIASNILCGWTS